MVPSPGRRPRRRLRLPLLLVALAAGSSARAQPLASPHDITTYGVVWTVPAMADVAVRDGFKADAGAAGEVPFAITYPRSPAPGDRFPVVVFANVTGADFRTWRIYADWARLVAAHGMAGVVYQSAAADAGASLRAIVDQLRRDAAALALDAERWAVWACSANVSLALPYLMGETPPGLRGAVLYYGATPVPELRRDLPLLYVLAERDSPQLNNGIRTLWSEAARVSAPWTMVVATGLPHAFDALVESPESRRLVERTVRYLSEALGPAPAPGPAPDAARRALTAIYGQDWNGAAVAYGEMAAADPNDATAQRLLGQALVRGGRAAEAVASLERALASGAERWDVHENLGFALLAAGKPQQAAAEFDRSLAGGPPARRPAALYNMACAYALAGATDEAFGRLTAALDAGFADRNLFATDPDLASLRADPRFAALLARLPER